MVSIDDTVYEATLTNFPIPSTSPRMGRPPLGNKATQVRLSEEVRDRIRGLVGEKGMAQFIREAVDRELRRRERQEVGEDKPRKGQ